MRCNICGGKNFIDMNKRVKVKCEQCGSLERTRLFWMYLKRISIDGKTKILHLAPERGLYEKFSALCEKGNYVTADLTPNRYPFAPNCRKIDLCDLDREQSCEYDLIVHSHVMEHIPCNIAYTLFHLHRMLRPEGIHACIIPFLAGKYDECFQEIGDDERVRRFGQFDHVRRFGRDDIPAHLGSVVNVPSSFDATDLFLPDDLRSANIPQNQWKGFHTGTILMLRKSDMRLIGSAMPS